MVTESSLTDAATAELGREATTAAVQSWGGDDFAWYLREVPGTYVRVGTHDLGLEGSFIQKHHRDVFGFGNDMRIG